MCKIFTTMKVKNLTVIVVHIVHISVHLTFKFFTDGKRHLICEPYSVENLHKMARILNIKKCWFHGGKYPHYDIPKRRQKEIEDQCELISSKELLKLIKESIENEIC